MGVVEADDVVCDVSDGLLGIGVVTLPDALDLQVQEEALHDCVIPAVSLSAHNGKQAMADHQVSVGLTCVLAVAIGVHNHSGLGLA